MTARGASTGSSDTGLFLTFEGTEGCGKTTQLERLARRLERELHVDVTRTREPGGTPLGQELRRLLLSTDGATVSSPAEMLLYVADRAQHLVEVVEPALARGEWVLCDRYLDATLAYQGGGRGIDVDEILALHRLSPLDRRPDRTLLLDVDVEAGLDRARRRNADDGLTAAEGRFEAEELAFHQRVRDAYHRLADADTKRVRVIDARGSIDEVADRIDAAIADLLPVRS